MQEVSNLDRDKVMLIMTRLKFFKDFSEYEKKRISAFHTHFQKYKMSEYIIRENNTDTSFFIIITGAVSIIKAGKSTALAELGEGDFFGEVSFLTGRPRTTNVLANEPTLVLRVDRELMEGLGADIREKIKDRIITQLVQRLDDMNDLLMKFSYGARF